MADDYCSTGDVCCTPPALRLPEPQAVKPLEVTNCDADAACGCQGGVPRFDGLDPRYKRVLWTVIGNNGAMFLTEMVAGQLLQEEAAVAPQKFESRRQSLPQPVAGFELAIHTGQGDLNLVAHVLQYYSSRTVYFESRSLFARRSDETVSIGGYFGRSARRALVRGTSIRRGIENIDGETMFASRVVPEDAEIRFAPSRESCT